MSWNVLDLKFTQHQVWQGLILTACCLGSTTVGCAYNATGLAPPKTLIFEYSIEGPAFVQSADKAYYFVLDTKGKPEDGPLINGSAPLSFPFPDPRAYLPFARDERAILDRDPISVPDSVWDTYFALYEEAGQFVVWQGRPNPDGTVNERVRQLQKGREWGFTNERTLQLTLPFTLIRSPDLAPDAEDPPEWEANLAVAPRSGGRLSRDYIIERWGRVQNQNFSIKTSPINQNLFDTVSGVTFPQNVPAGIDQANLNIVSITYRIVSDGRKR